MAGLLSGPVKELDETAEATMEATMEEADLYMCIYVHEGQVAHRQPCPQTLYCFMFRGKWKNGNHFQIKPVF